MIKFLIKIIFLLFLFLQIDDGFAIVNGVITSITEFPWQVSVRDNVGHLCGGAIISEKLVLTSAYCVHDNSLGRNKQLTILSGTINQDNEKSGQIHLVKRKIIHKDFNYNKNDNDIALLQLDGSFRFGPTRQPINLPSNEIITETKAKISGWGQTHHNDQKLSKILLKLDTHIINIMEIKIRFPKFLIENKRVYTYENSGAGISTGDGGGALTVNLKNYNIIIGIAERYFPDKKSPGPDTYVDVKQYVNWINEQKKQLHEN